LDGSSSDLSKVLSHHLPEGTEEIMKTSVRIAHIPAEIQTELLPNKKQDRLLLLWQPVQFHLCSIQICCVFSVVQILKVKYLHNSSILTKKIGLVIMMYFCIWEVISLNLSQDIGNRD
jgi:hypothetical protein